MYYRIKEIKNMFLISQHTSPLKFSVHLAEIGL